MAFRIYRPKVDTICCGTTTAYGVYLQRFKDGTPEDVWAGKANQCVLVIKDEFVLDLAVSS